mgnify:CR=1 FL=1
MKLFTLFFVLIFANSCTSQHGLTPEQQAHLEQLKRNFVFVEGGTFVMGKRGIPQASSVHEVTLDSYSISKYETTFKDFDLYTTTNGLDSIAPRWRKNEGMGPDFGAAFMTWFAARDYCIWLGKQLQLPIDLPTEAQWEYAARSRGLDVQHATNSGLIEGGDKDNYGDGEVGSYPPNPLGIYDMSGGRPEWVRDYAKAYNEKPRVNPVQDTVYMSKNKIVRGWHTLSNSVYGRGIRAPEFDKDIVGFRCVCNQKIAIN